MRWLTKAYLRVARRCGASSACVALKGARRCRLLGRSLVSHGGADVRVALCRRQAASASTHLIADAAHSRTRRAREGPCAPRDGRARANACDRRPRRVARQSHRRAHASRSLRRTPYAASVVVVRWTPRRSIARSPPRARSRTSNARYSVAMSCSTPSIAPPRAGARRN